MENSFKKFKKPDHMLVGVAIGDWRFTPENFINDIVNTATVRFSIIFR